MAARTAASDVFTVNLERIGATTVRPLLENFQVGGAATSSIVMQSWLREDRQATWVFLLLTNRRGLRIRRRGSSRCVSRSCCCCQEEGRSESQRRYSPHCVDDPVGQHEPQADVRIRIQEFGRKRQQMRMTETPRRRHRQVTFGGPVLAGQFSFGVVDLLNDALARIDVGPPRISQGDPSGMSSETAALSDVLPSSATWRLTVATGVFSLPARRGGEASRLRHGNDNRHRLQAVHLAPAFPSFEKAPSQAYGLLVRAAIGYSLKTLVEALKSYAGT
jgi:hypothetical protein